MACLVKGLDAIKVLKVNYYKHIQGIESFILYKHVALYSFTMVHICILLVNMLHFCHQVRQFEL